MVTIEEFRAEATIRATLRNKSCEKARKEIEQAFYRSKLKDHANEYPAFSKEELTMGKFLGKGGFGSVYDVLAFKDGSAHPLKGKRAEKDDEASGVESRRFIAEHCHRNDGDARYAVRLLNEDVIKDSHKLYLGVLDNAVLTKFLEGIDHPHIIKLRATAKSDPCSADYFMVMDKLYSTLDKRILQWEKKRSRFSGFMGKFTDPKLKKTQQLWNYRMSVAYDVSTALAYMHEQNLVFRDLKPDNIGFDIDGQVKIFDFGLAKEIFPEDADKDGLYKLTEMTGSLQYMAPEVAMGLPYNATCDVYSFSVLLWEMLALKRPYENYAPSAMPQKIWSGPHKRPLLDASWSETIQNMLKKGWSKDYVHERYSMKHMSAILQEECTKNE